MRIDKFEVYQVAMPLIYPWRTAYGEDPEIHSVLVKATSGNHTAWSESSPLYAPMYLPESAGSVFYNVSEFFAPFILNHEFESAEQINQKLSQALISTSEPPNWFLVFLKNKSNSYSSLT